MTPYFPDNIREREHEKFIENPSDGGTDVRVQDLEGNDLLTAILSALGGSSNTTPYIYNVVCASANTEYSQDLPANCKLFYIKSRHAQARVKLAYVATESGSNFISLGLGGVYTDPGFYQSQTLYFQTNIANATIEIVAFT